jgi:adenylate kinase
MDIVIMGPPGAGKGTQANALAQKLGVVHVATGDLFRNAVQRGTPLGQQAQAYMSRGDLVPDAVTVGLLLERASEPDAARGMLLDGFPRTLAQAEALDQALQSRGRGVDSVLYLAVPPETLLTRISGRQLCSDCQATYHTVYRPPARKGHCDQCGGALYQREDDQRATAERRLSVYEQQTMPVVAYYRRRGVLAEIDGGQAIAAVQRALFDALPQSGSRASH